jgi:hypothetical protein
MDAQPKTRPLTLVSQPVPVANPRRHRCTVFVQVGAQRRRASAIDHARQLLRRIGVTPLQRVV